MPSMSVQKRKELFSIYEHFISPKFYRESSTQIEHSHIYTPSSRGDENNVMKRDRKELIQFSPYTIQKCTRLSGIQLEFMVQIARQTTKTTTTTSTMATANWIISMWEYACITLFLLCWLPLCVWACLQMWIIRGEKIVFMTFLFDTKRNLTECKPERRR